MTKLIKSPIPTYIITGFLGVGKTTTIKALLDTQFKGLKVAVLVNEFGEAGFDRFLLGQQACVSIKQVAGGCMCCSAKVTMQVALTQLIKQSVPDVLLIEPTGLGHPKEVLNVLQQPHFSSIVDIKLTVTLLDARHFSNSKYLEHEIFNQQLSVADMLVMNKVDSATRADIALMQRFLDDKGYSDTPIINANYGEINLSQLATAKTVTERSSLYRGFSLLEAEHTVLDDANTESLEFYSKLFNYPRSYYFDLDRLKQILSSLGTQGIIRIKGFVQTPIGVYKLNQAADDIEITIVNESELKGIHLGSSFEVIADRNAFIEQFHDLVLTCETTQI